MRRRGEGTTVEAPLCPISLDPIPIERCFKVYVTPTATYAYDAKFLIEFLVHGSHPRCPMTRTAFSWETIQRLYAKGRRHCISRTRELEYVLQKLQGVE